MCFTPFCETQLPLFQFVGRWFLSSQNVLTRHEKQTNSRLKDPAVNSNVKAVYICRIRKENQA